MIGLGTRAWVLKERDNEEMKVKICQEGFSR